MRATLLCLVLASLLSSLLVPVGAVTVDEARSQLGVAFTGVQRAERAGGNVTGLVSRLNSAALLLDSGGDINVTKASAIISDVIASTPGVETAGAQSESMRLALTVAALVVLGVLAVLVWRFGSRLYWGLWLRARGDWRVERV